MKKNIGIVFIILYIAVATFITMMGSSLTRVDYDEREVFIDIDLSAAQRCVIDTTYNYPRAPASTILGYILINILIFGMCNFISSLVIWSIFYCLCLESLATKKVLILMSIIPIIILLAQLIIMIPRYVVR